MSKLIRAGILGGAGYTGGELLRLLLNHPSVEIAFVHSKSKAGHPVFSVHTDLLGDTELRFTDTLESNIDVLFLCLAHGESQGLMSKIDPGIKIIDLSQDFRLSSDPLRPFVYGLPELNRTDIRSAQNIANPGCFATAIQLGLLPLASKNAIDSDVTVSCTTGSTGAGRSLSETAHFSWRQNNLSVYKAFTHQHIPEIEQSLRQLQPAFQQQLLLFPQRGAFTRGILACMNLRMELDIDELKKWYQAYYKRSPFVFVSDVNIDLKQVVNTNKCLLYLEKYKDQLLVISVIDNLLKGASGQAVQNMNLLFDLPEATGLKLKASAF